MDQNSKDKYFLVNFDFYRDEIFQQIFTQKPPINEEKRNKKFFRLIPYYDNYILVVSCLEGPLSFSSSRINPYLIVPGIVNKDFINYLRVDIPEWDKLDEEVQQKVNKRGEIITSEGKDSEEFKKLDSEVNKLLLELDLLTPKWKNRKKLYKNRIPIIAKIEAGKRKRGKKSVENHLKKIPIFSDKPLNFW